MNRKTCKRVTAMLLTAVLTVGAVLPGGYAYAESTTLPGVTETQEPDGGTEGTGAEETVTPDSGTETEPVLYDAEERTDLMENEIATAEDIVVAAGFGFDVENDFEGISYDENAVKVSFYKEKGSFDGDTAGEYDTYYKIMPESNREAYLIHRTITVKETESVSADSTGTGTDQDDGGGSGSGDGDSEDGDPDGGDSDDGDPGDSGADNDGDGLDTFTFSVADLAAGEMQDLTVDNPVTFKIASLSVMKAAAPSAGDSLKVSSNGYAKYCGHSMGIKYISSSGDYHNHLVYCMDIGKNTTNGTVKAGSTAKVKPQITYCLVNGARTLNGKCHNDKYSAGSASEDYFITGAAVHVLNGEVKLSYYNNGSTVYKKIAALVEDAKKYKESEYADNGLTKSITYDISPKKSEWKEKSEGLYRSADKFVRTKSGTVKDVKYTITGAPSGLTVGEIKTDASEIDDEKDLKKYDICVAQTDASKASSNFYLYCNAEALAKIQAAKATIKVKAKAYSDEKGGRKWTPTVVSQQKITFLEEFTDVKTDEATVKVTAGDFKQGYFSLKKTDKFSGQPVAGAKYYLYEDKECEDLFCKLAKTSDVGLAQSTTELLTQDTYYLKEVFEADGYQRDERVYEIPLKYFTIVDAAGKVTQKAETYPVVEIPEPVCVAVNKKDTGSGNIVKGAGFAVFYDAACTKRVTEDGTAGGKEVPVFYYDEDTELAVSAKFAHTQETYYVKEAVVPDPYKDNGKVIPVKPDNGAMAEVSMDNTPARYGVDAVKEDAETKVAQGDATLEGATYGLYAAENIQYPDGRGVVAYKDNDNITSTKGTEFQSTGAAANKDALLATVKTDAEGRFNFANLYYGNYYIREISESEGYLLDSTVYPVNFKEEEKHKDITVQRTVKENVIKQPFSILKVSKDGEDTDLVEGAEFTVKLQSEIDSVGWDAAKTYDTLVTDDKGYAVSKELPYGTYLVKETKVPKDLYKTDDFTVEITGDSREPQEYRTLNDAPFKAYIRFIKKDAESGKTVLLSGVTFKIRKAGTEEYVEQKTGEKTVSEFVTDETGTVTTPLSLKYGDYECVEVKAPEGYVVSKEAFPFSVHMGEDGENVIKVEGEEDGDPVIAVEIEDKQAKGKLTIHKQGEMLSSIGYDSIIDRILDFIGGEDRTIHFNYEKRDLSGAEFQVIAAEDIYTPDNQKDADGNRVPAVVNDVPATEGAVLATLTTDFEGKATLDDLPLGKYKVVEVKAPAGFVVDPEAKEVELKYKDQETEVVYGEAEFEDIRIRPELSLVKTDSVTKKPAAGAVYGLYAAEDIYIESGIVKSEVSAQPEETAGSTESSEETDSRETGNEDTENSEDSTGEGADADKDDDARQETAAPTPAGIATAEPATETPAVEGEGGAETGSDNAPVVSGVPVSETTVPQTSADVVSGPAIALSSAISVAVKADELIATAVTDEDGNAKFDVDLPLGKYYVKEIEAPAGYLKDENSYPADFSFRPEMGTKEELTLEMEDTPIIVEVSKKDVTTGQEIRGAKLEITDDKGKTYASWTTDGKPYRLEAMPAGKYTLKETFAPYGYMIANEVEFTVEETGEIQKVEMVDERVKGFIEIHKICSETKKPIEGVSFELQNKEGKVLAVLKTDKKGYAKTELLDICTYKKDGSYDKDIPYYIVESKTAKGYILDRTKHEVFLQYDDSATEPVGYTLTVKNKPDHPLPQTGGDYRPWLFALGGALLAGAGVVIYRRRRRRIAG